MRFNTPGSPLAEQADATILSAAGEEFSVSCKTYLAALMALQWLGDIVCERDSLRTRQELEAASQAVRNYLVHWKAYVQDLAQMLDGTRNLFLVGRGPSLAAVGTGALTIKESDHFPAALKAIGLGTPGAHELQDVVTCPGVYLAIWR